MVEILWAILAIAICVAVIIAMIPLLVLFLWAVAEMAAIREARRKKDKRGLRGPAGD